MAGPGWSGAPWAVIRDSLRLIVDAEPGQDKLDDIAYVTSGWVLKTQG